MKISAQEEYGLRILLCIAKGPHPEGISIPEISQAEGLSIHNVAKLCRILRLGGYVQSQRGKEGGYVLAKPADKIVLSHVLEDLGGRLFPEEFCNVHTGIARLCTNSVECSVRSLWQIVQLSVDRVLDNLTLQHLIEPRGDLQDALPAMVAADAVVRR